MRTISVKGMPRLLLAWDIYKGKSRVREDFSRAQLWVWLDGPSGRIPLSVEVSPEGSVMAQLPDGLGVGVYSVCAVWTKEQDPKTCLHQMLESDRRCRSEVRHFLCLSRAADAEEVEREVWLRVESMTATYGYDGLGAWEVAVMRGYRGTEEEFYHSHLKYAYCYEDEGYELRHDNVLRFVMANREAGSVTKLYMGDLPIYLGTADSAFFRRVSLLLDGRDVAEFEAGDSVNLQEPVLRFDSLRVDNEGTFRAESLRMRIGETVVFDGRTLPSDGIVQARLSGQPVEVALGVGTHIMEVSATDTYGRLVSLKGRMVYVAPKVSLSLAGATLRGFDSSMNYAGDANGFDGVDGISVTGRLASSVRVTLDGTSYDGVLEGNGITLDGRKAFAVKPSYVLQVEAVNYYDPSDRIVAQKTLSGDYTKASMNLSAALFWHGESAVSLSALMVGDELAVTKVTGIKTQGRLASTSGLFVSLGTQEGTGTLSGDTLILDGELRVTLEPAQVFLVAVRDGYTGEEVRAQRGITAKAKAQKAYVGRVNLGEAGFIGNAGLQAQIEGAVSSGTITVQGLADSRHQVSLEKFHSAVVLLPAGSGWRAMRADLAGDLVFSHSVAKFASNGNVRVTLAGVEYDVYGQTVNSSGSLMIHITK